MIQKASPKLTELMNRAVSAGLQAIIQHMWRHVRVKGMNASG